MTNTHSRVRNTATSVAVALLGATAATGVLAAPASAAPDQSVAAASTTNVVIPDQGATTPASTTVTIPANRGQVTDVDVSLNGIDHTCISDLEVTLVHDGVSVKVMDDAGDCNADQGAARTFTFDDEASSLMTYPLPPDYPSTPSGRYKPTDGSGSDPVATALSVFDGTAASGTWELVIVDQYGGDEGNLPGWSIDIDYNDPSAPSGSVLIDGGAATAASAVVTLGLAASDPAAFTTGLTTMRFSNDGTNWSAFQPYATTAAWTLSAGDGTKTVWVQYADGIGNLSVPASDTIVLDTKAPRAKKLKPKKNSTGVKTSAKVSFVASEALDPSTVTKRTVKLIGGGKAVKAKVTYYAGSKKVVLKPKKDLAAGTTYKVKVSKRITDVAGNAMGAKKWKFTTR